VSRSQVSRSQVSRSQVSRSHVSRSHVSRSHVSRSHVTSHVTSVLYVSHDVSSSQVPARHAYSSLCLRVMHHSTLLCARVQCYIYARVHASADQGCGGRDLGVHVVPGLHQLGGLVALKVHQLLLQYPHLHNARHDSSSLCFYHAAHTMAKLMRR
jgi:hypothetical protein